MEALRLRVKDLDFERLEPTVHDGKGGKDRRRVVPKSLAPALQQHLQRVRSLHQRDLAAGWGKLLMSYALARKYPNATANGDGNGSSLSRIDGVTGDQVPRAATISIQAW